MEPATIYACKEHAEYHFISKFKETRKSEVLSITARYAKAARCAYDGCTKDGKFMISVQYFPQISNKLLK